MLIRLFSLILCLLLSSCTTITESNGDEGNPLDVVLVSPLDVVLSGKSEFKVQIVHNNFEIYPPSDGDYVQFKSDLKKGNFQESTYRLSPRKFNEIDGCKYTTTNRYNNHPEGIVETGKMVCR